MAVTKPGTPPVRARIGNTGENGRRQPAPCLSHRPRGEELPISRLQTAALPHANEPVDDPGDNGNEDERQDPECLARSGERLVTQYVCDEDNAQNDVDDMRAKYTLASRVDERRGAYFARDVCSPAGSSPWGQTRAARYSRASATSASKSAASSPASGCHWTPTVKRRDGSSTASSVPSAAHAVSTSPSPTRPSA